MEAYENVFSFDLPLVVNIPPLVETPTGDTRVMEDILIYLFAYLGIDSHINLLEIKLVFNGIIWFVDMLWRIKSVVFSND